MHIFCLINFDATAQSMLQQANLTKAQCVFQFSRLTFLPQTGSWRVQIKQVLRDLIQRLVLRDLKWPNGQVISKWLYNMLAKYLTRLNFPNSPIPATAHYITYCSVMQDIMTWVEWDHVLHFIFMTSTTWLWLYINLYMYIYISEAYNFSNDSKCVTRQISILLFQTQNCKV